jgi:hypothetical protein
MSRLLYLLGWIQNEQGSVTFINMTNNEPNHNIVWVLLSTFVLIGIALLITAGLGAGVGAIRIYIFKHFPGNKWNGPEYEPVTRLHLDERPESDTPQSS